jgi:hypothetical protein
MSAEERVAKYAAFMSTVTATGVAVLALKKAPPPVPFPQEVIDLINALNEGMALSLADLNDIITLLQKPPIPAYPPNADYAQIIIVNCQVANQAYPVPDFPVPDDFDIIVKAHPANPVGTLLFSSTQSAPNPQMAYPHVPNEAKSYRLKSTGGLWVFSPVAGNQAVIAVEQRRLAI